MKKLYLSELTSSLVPEDMAPAAAAEDRPVRIDEERIGARSRNQTDASFPRHTRDTAHRVRAHDIVIRHRVELSQRLLQLPVSRLLFAAAQAQPERFQLQRLRNVGLQFRFGHHLCDATCALGYAHDPMVRMWTTDDGQYLSVLVTNRAFGM